LGLELELELGVELGLELGVDLRLELGSALELERLKLRLRLRTEICVFSSYLTIILTSVSLTPIESRPWLGLQLGLRF
jgi:hypothetical protein